MRKKSKQKKAAQPVAAVAWYRSEQWQRLLQVSADREKLESTFEEWRTAAEKLMAQLEGLGLALQKVEVDVEELVLWCASRKLPVDGEARSAFAAHKLREADMKKPA